MKIQFALPKKVSKRDLTQFTSYLAEFLAAGIPLLKSLQLLHKESKNPLFHEAIEQILGQVRKGDSFSQALGLYPAIFDSFYIQLVEAGETSGKLEQVLVRLSIALEKELDLRSKITMAFAYPSFVFAFGIFTIFFLMIFMVPKISTIYEDFGGEFPLITRIVLGLSHWFFHVGWVLGVLGAGTVFYLITTRRTEPFRKALDRLLIRTPWFKELIVEAETVRFSRSLSILLEGGVPMIIAIRLSVRTIMSESVRQKMEGLDRLISEGSNLSESLRGRAAFPDLMLDLIWVGESTGNMAASLDKFTSITEKEIDRRIKIITTLIEPFIIVVTGLVVGLIVVALLLPIFEMSLLVQ